MIESSFIRPKEHLHVDISFVLGDGNGLARQSTQPVTLYLTINVQANRPSPGIPPNIPTEGGNTPAEDVSTSAPDSMGPDQYTKSKHPLSPTDQLPVQGNTPTPQDQAEMSLVDQAQISLDLAEEAKKSIGPSNTWGGVVGRIKWLMDTLSPIAGLHPIAQMAYSVISVIPQELADQYQRDDNVRTLVESMHDALDFTRHEDTLKCIKPDSKQADIIALMLRDVCSCSDFIQSYTKDSLFFVRTLKNLGSGVEGKFQELSSALQEHRRAFLDQAVITTEITAFQILNDVGNVVDKIDGISTQLKLARASPPTRAV